MHTEKFFFYNNKSQRLAGEIYKKEDSPDGVIFCHGLFSTKSGYKITRLAERIVDIGFTLMTFDFSFVGESEGDISELSILQEVEDLHSAFQFFMEYGIKNIHLIGSSMGGTVSLLFSSVKTEIRSQILIAAPMILAELLSSRGIDNVDSLPENGTTEIDGISIGNKFFREIPEINIESAISKTCTPTLIIHGFKDDVVSPASAVMLIKSLSCEKRIVLIEDGDHNLTRDSDLEILGKNIAEWLQSHR